MINRAVQAVSVLAVVWVFWQAIQERLTPGVTLVAMGVVLLSIAMQYVVLKQEGRDSRSADASRPPERLT